MKTIFLALALLYVAATATAIWSSVTDSRARRRKLLLMSWPLTTLLLVGAGSLFWILKDGLGPDSVTSTGFVAIGRFARSAWFPFSIILLFPVLCSLFGRARKPIQTTTANDLHAD